MMYKVFLIILFVCINNVFANQCCYEGSQILSSVYCQTVNTDNVYSYVIVGNSTKNLCPSNTATIVANYNTMQDSSFKWFTCRDKIYNYEYQMVGGCGPQGLYVSTSALDFSNNKYFYLSNCIYINGGTSYSTILTSSVSSIQMFISQAQNTCSQTGGNYFSFSSWTYGNTANCQDSNGQCSCPSGYTPASC
ncbi:hypothetical protein DICPUDRAFT_75020 [Dictyostelium purpureum]|uniref:EGF-like domain-containing protein n=1 Tax=Dictyostelium purpureum TaxID=5786 RepID=F0Z9E6_DICPU|nr:uncharacterized protein DICPUDRAFT_75020 [Dictyostelium purpureum]EGC39461.1 hypothetical protein DICPUDRAFT_75020 [Dictyostelium purpureum]|eukprot:XP_003284019.1 hypothetical protein DICPUDRAFT_75020 [Dictyostelium purpureum]